MATSIKIAFIGAGSAQFCLNVIKDLCLTDDLSGCHVSLMDVDQERLELAYSLAKLYAQQLGANLTFEKTTDRHTALAGADFVINASFVLGHRVEKKLRDIASEKHNYFYYTNYFNYYHQLWILSDIVQSIQEVCPDAWLLQLGNPVLEGLTLIARTTNVKFIGLCHGYQGYREIASVIGIDPDKVTAEAIGLNHNIWLTDFKFNGEDAYSLIDEWISRASEAFWQNHKADNPHDVQMSRCAIDQYKLYGLFPVGDTARRGGWWYHVSTEMQKFWFGVPWGGPDNPVARDAFINGLEQCTGHMRVLVSDSSVDLPKVLGTERSRQQIIPIINALTNGREGVFQVNVLNKGIINHIPDNIVVEVPAIIDENGMRPVKMHDLPEKIIVERIIPECINVERTLLAYMTGDKSVLLYDILENRQTASLQGAKNLLEVLMTVKDVAETENKQKIPSVSSYFKYR